MGPPIFLFLLGTSYLFVLFRDLLSFPFWNSSFPRGARLGLHEDVSGGDDICCLAEEGTPQDRSYPFHVEQKRVFRHFRHFLFKTTTLNFKPIYLDLFFCLRQTNYIPGA